MWYEIKMLAYEIQDIKGTKVDYWTKKARYIPKHLPRNPNSFLWSAFSYELIINALDHFISKNKFGVCQGSFGNPSLFSNITGY